MNNRPADGTTKLLEDVQRFRDAIRLVDGVVGSRSGVAVVVESVAMEGVGAGLGDGVHEARCAAAVSRRVGRDSHLEFLDRVFSEGVGHPLTPAGVSEVIAGGVGAVQSK